MGIEFVFHFDVALGYRLIFFSIWKYGDPWLVLNPSVFADVGIQSWITFKLGAIDIRINVDFTGYRFTPLDYQGMWNFNKTSNYCHGLQLLTEALDLQIRLETFVNECFFGPFGYLNQPDDPIDCFRRRYYPKIPIWEATLLDETDSQMNLYEWTCNYEGDANLRIPGRDSNNKNQTMDASDMDESEEDGIEPGNTDGAVLDQLDDLPDEASPDSPSESDTSDSDKKDENDGEEWTYDEDEKAEMDEANNIGFDVQDIEPGVM